MSKLAIFCNLQRAVGFRAAALVFLRKLLGIRTPVWARAQGVRFAIRPLDSDLFVASQIFGGREYDPGPAVEARLNRLAARWREAGQLPVIIDAGANVGYSALCFAQRYPQAVVVARARSRHLRRAGAQLRRRRSRPPRARSALGA